MFYRWKVHEAKLACFEFSSYKDTTSDIYKMFYYTAATFRPILYTLSMLL